MTDTNLIEAYECKFVQYVKNHITNDDLHVVKEVIHYKDGTSKNNLRLIKNFKRPYYITKKGKRTYQSKKEWCIVDDCDKFESTQKDLVYNVAKSLGKFNHRGSLKDICTSPYVYGVDIKSTCVLKQKYFEKYNKFTSFKVAVFDVETDVVNGTEEILMATLSFKDKVFTCIRKDFLGIRTDVINSIHQKSKEIIGNVLTDRNINLELLLVDTEIDIITKTLEKAHEWQPDFITGWNLTYDIDKLVAGCDRAGVDPAVVFSDPSIPNEYKYFKFHKATSSKVTASGVYKAKKNIEMWNYVICPSSFYWVDAMTAYFYIRIGEPLETSYSLDSILKKKLGITKLKFEQTAKYTGIKWHQVMQSDYPIEYIVYNIFDCISLEMLDEKTKDLASTLPIFSGYSDFSNFDSQPRRLVDGMHFDLLAKYNRIMASTSSALKEDVDAETLSLKQWIIMLPIYLRTNGGLRIIKDNPNLMTNIYTHVFDLDVSSSYPYGIIALNISKETTVKEVIEIAGISETDMRMATINLSGGQTNALEICNKLFGMPTLEQLDREFDYNLLESL